MKTSDAAQDTMSEEAQRAFVSGVLWALEGKSPHGVTIGRNADGSYWLRDVDGLLFSPILEARDAATLLYALNHRPALFDRSTR